MHSVTTNRSGGLCLPSISVVRLIDCPDMTIAVYCTGWRPVVAVYQWWPFASCTRNYACVAPQIRLFCKRKQMKHPQIRLIKFSALEAKSKQFYQPILMPTSLYFRGMKTVHTHIIKYRNKHVQIAVYIFPYHE